MSGECEITHERDTARDVNHDNEYSLDADLDK